MSCSYLTVNILAVTAKPHILSPKMLNTETVSTEQPQTQHEISKHKSKYAEKGLRLFCRPLIRLLGARRSPWRRRHLW